MAAARILLLGILFTEVLKPACAAGVKGVGSNLSGKNGSKSENLDISLWRNVGLSFLVEPKGDVVLGRKGITLGCSTGSGNNVTWLYNGASVPPCEISRCILLPNGSLRIYTKKNLQEKLQKHKARDTKNLSRFENKNENNYRCIARTNFGGMLRSSPTYVQVAEIAKGFKESPKALKIQEGEVARFDCSIDSVPSPPNIKWLHNGELLKTDFNDTKYFIIPRGVLYINSVKLSDAGSYRCVATNEFLNKTKTSKEAKLTVLSRHGTAEEQETFLLPQSAYYYSLLNGSSIQLACAASGFPIPSTIWSFVPLQTDVIKPRILLNSTSGISILKINNVSPSDSGYYLCSFADQQNNSMKYQNITIEVLVPPSFIKKPSSQIGPNGKTVRFECQAQGHPTPQIYWLKDAKNITDNGRRTVYKKDFNRMELAISATVPSDSGIYQCVAVNAAGEIWAAGRLQVNTSRNSLAAPTNLKCHAVSPVHIFISWEPPKFLPITSITAYTVHYSPVEGGKEEVSPPEPGNSTSVVVTKLLEPFTNYSFYIRLWNSRSASDQSATIVCSTAPSVPKAAPKIKIDVISSTKLNVTWKPLRKKEAQGIVVEYKLQWRLHQSTTNRVQLLPANVEHYVLKDLTPGALYEIRVLARTEQGWPNVTDSQLSWRNVTMPSSMENQFSLENIMEIEITNVNTTSIKIQWKMKEDAHNHIEEMFDSWQIYCKNRKNERILSFILPKNTSEYLLSNLEVNMTYTIGLCMMNINNPVGCLVEVVQSIHDIPNDVPVGLEATPISSNSILLTWKMSNQNKVSLFEICYHAVHTTKDESKCITVDNTTVTVNKLRPYTLYQFKVRALNNNNNEDSPFSETIECYSKEDVPGKIEDVQWFRTNRTNVRVAWKEPSKINGLIQKYLVSYTTDLSEPTSSWGSVEVPGNKTFVALPALISGERYFVMVQASTKAGYGRRSDPIIIASGGNPSKIPTSSDERKPPPNVKHDQSLGIILGVGISIVFITICLCSMYCRRKCETSRLLHHSAQARKMRVLPRDSNGCCIERASTSASQQNITINNACNEIELAVLCPSTPLTNSHVDTKGVANGIVEPCVKEPLLLPWDVNGDNKDVHITEYPELKEADNISTKQPKEEQEEDFDVTQLTMVNCTLRASNSSLNNNLGCANDATLEKAPHIPPVPILETNG